MIDDTFIFANRVEAGLWFVIAAACIVAIVVRPAARWDSGAAALAFLAFGLSDLVETRTGAWWRPWWLLGWKAACLAVFAALLVRYARRRRSRRGWSMGGTGSV